MCKTQVLYFIERDSRNGLLKICDFYKNKVVRRIFYVRRYDDMSKLPIALQVYSIREEAAQDFKGSMQQVKKMGYDGVELAGLYGHTPEEIRDILKEVGLTAISAHVPYLDLIADMGGTVGQYVTI
jgi:hypothetical protein